MWRHVMGAVAALEAKAPDGFEVVVSAYIDGRPEPFEFGGAQTSRDVSDPFTVLQSLTKSEGDSEKANPDVEVIVVHEDRIERVEIRYEPVKGKARVGFSHEETGSS